MNRNVDDFIPCRLQVILERDRTAFLNAVEQNASIWIRFTKCLHISQVMSLLKMHPENTNGRNIASRTCNTRQCHRLPFNEHLSPASLGIMEVEPLLSLLRQSEHVVKLNLIPA